MIDLPFMAISDDEETPGADRARDPDIDPDAADSGNFSHCYTCGRTLPVDQRGNNPAPYRAYSREDNEGFLVTWVIRLCPMCADSWFD